MSTLAQRVASFAMETNYDFVRMGQVMAAASTASDADPGLSRMKRTLALLGMMLDRGFQAVDLLPEGGCKPWPDQGKMHILRTIERDWSALNDEPWIGSKYWFTLPEALRPTRPLED